MFFWKIIFCTLEKKFFKDKSYYTASINKIAEPIVQKSSKIDSKISNLVKIFNKLIHLAPYLSEEQATTLSTIVDSGKIADRAASFLNINIDAVIKTTITHNLWEIALYQQTTMNS